MSESASLPAVAITQTEAGGRQVKLLGIWTLSNLLQHPAVLKNLQKQAATSGLSWDLTGIERLDTTASLMIWEAWGGKLPSGLAISPAHQQLLERWQDQKLPAAVPEPPPFVEFYNFLTRLWRDFFGQILSLLTMLGQLVLDIGYLLIHPGAIPWAEISITIYEAGVRALGITALVGFLIGIVLSYLSALQLKMFGAEIYIIPILGLSIIRELGPLLAAILVAGRSGSAMTAQIGIMRVTEELDALSAMGISHSLRLVLPKVIALAMVMPLLSMWTNSAALLGGMLSAQNTLDISYQQFFQKLPQSVPLVNVFIGLGKSAAFGLAIALIACHFGFRIKPNTESLGQQTTSSVVVAITVVIMLDAVFAILFMKVGV